MSPIWLRLRLQNALGRAYHTSAAVGHMIYSFGGYGIEGDYDSKRPIVVDSLDTNTLEWSSVPYTYDDSVDDIPFNRYGHIVIADGHMIYLWGGKNCEDACNVLFAFNSLTSKWSRPTVSGSVPHAHRGHSATVCGRKMYIFGGIIRNQSSQDLHSLDLDTFTWDYIATEGMSPAGEFCYSLSCIDETLYVFCGAYDKQDSYGELVYENQIVCLDLRSLTWSRPVTKNAPTPRTCHSAFVFNNCLYIFGGWNGLTKQMFNDLHMYNPVTREWTKVSTQGTPPCPHRWQSCNLVKSKLFLFGRKGPTENLTDLFVLDLSPSLETLAKLTIIRHSLSTTHLPAKIQKKISDMAETSAPGISGTNTGNKEKV